MSLTLTRDDNRNELTDALFPASAASTALPPALSVSSSTISPATTSLLAPSSGPDLFRGWYLDTRATGGRSWSDPAKQAYEAAIDILTRELSIEERDAEWLRGKTSMRDVQDALLAAQEAYRDKAKASKARAWLAACSSRVMYYSSVFDVFVQHYPEYVSLAWGAFKFLFVAVINHENLLAEIAKAVSRIADVLPRTELHSVLYPSQDVREAVARVYASVLEFAVAAVRWYRKGKLSHSVASVIKPFSLSFKPLVDELAERARLVDRLASAAMKAELRDMHLVIREMHAGQRGMSEEMRRLQEQLAGIMLANQTLQSQMLLGMHSQRQLFVSAQLSHVEDTFLPAPGLSHGDALTYCRSLRNRRRQRTPAQLPTSEIAKLQIWLQDPLSSLLLARGRGVRTSALDFAVDLLDAVLEAGYPVVWALPGTISESEARDVAEGPSLAGILRSLVLQVLNLDTRAMSEGVNPVTSQHFRSATSAEHWFCLLERCITPLPRLFVVIDMGILESALEHDRDSDHGGEQLHIGDVIKRFEQLAQPGGAGGRVLKIAVISWRFDAARVLEAEEVFDADRQILTDGGRRHERLMRQPKFRAVFRRQKGKSMERFRSMVKGLGDGSRGTE